MVSSENFEEFLFIESNKKNVSEGKWENQIEKDQKKKTENISTSQEQGWSVFSKTHSVNETETLTRLILISIMV